MKKLIFSAFVFLFAATSFAQEGELDNKWTNYMVETERRMIFDQAMDLESPKKEAFWQIYDEYEKELEGFRVDYMNDLKKYANEYATMTDEQANELVSSSFKRKMSRMKMQKKYHAQIVKMVDGKTAARFVQLDDAISMLMRLSVMDEIPFIGDF